ncbi:MAG: hypothetical protein ACRDDF_03980, partial [Aeromonas sp.]
LLSALLIATVPSTLGKAKIITRSLRQTHHKSPLSRANQFGEYSPFGGRKQKARERSRAF